MVSKHKENNQESLPEGDLEDKDYNPEEHEFISQLVAAKARVTPLKTGLTIPRSELSGLLLCTRLLSRIESLYSGGLILFHVWETLLASSPHWTRLLPVSIHSCTLA